MKNIPGHVIDPWPAPAYIQILYIHIYAYVMYTIKMYIDYNIRRRYLATSSTLVAGSDTLHGHSRFLSDVASVTTI